GDLRIETADELPSSNRRKQLTNISTIDRLEEILKRANPHAIICLLATISERLGTWRRVGDKGAIFKIKPKRRHNCGGSVTKHYPRILSG
ncbi:MAG: hypothetical protein ABEI86_11860, partial [Halobacteriaceae archaeon]